ncbi:putative polysaccharide biosynthesis protein [Thermoactinomyces mirandus]|uniref:Polysaccharide biosynthesis protein n=1 Tax=Thermoactinomyces mirandus TaxID=2756294 RepID=A0A7W1XQM2_9BACL|nr:polysaccharide biosynthesis protein [Thermoactinomyces mirandus]MBA4601255.1 polysaccharide biosynthesis protein [Thermoactinomyces mirandus]
MIEESRRSFIRGAVILGGAALFTKILSAVYKVPYQNITGDEGMYVYQQVYPLYSVLLLLATAGFPAAISKMVSEKWSSGQFEGVRQIFRISAISLFFLGLVFFLLLFFGAGQLAEWMGNRELLTLPIQTVSFALLVVPFLAVMRGFFQGQQNMVPTAASQMVEQVIRVATILILAWYFMDAGLGFVSAGAGAVFGATTGAIGALFVLLYYWRKNQLIHRNQFNATGTTGLEPPQKVMETVFRLSLPICIGSLILPLFSLVDSFTVANFLVDLGWEMERAIRLKGVFDRGQPLIQVATFFATAIALSIVPAISEARAKRQEKEVEDQSRLALQLTWGLGLPASVGLAVIAEPTNVMLFEDANGSDTLAILSFTGVFSSLAMVTAGILQGLGKVYLPAIYLLIGVVLKTGLNALLIPVWDIRGAAAATVVAFAFTALLQFIKLRQLFRWKTWFHRKMLLSSWAVVWMGFAVYGVSYGVQRLMLPVLEFRLAMMITALSSVLVGMIVYLWALFRFGAWSRADLEKVPKLQRKLVPLLDKWGWLPDSRE